MHWNQPEHFVHARFDLKELRIMGRDVFADLVLNHARYVIHEFFFVALSSGVASGWERVWRLHMASTREFDSGYPNNSRLLDSRNAYLFLCQ